MFIRARLRKALALIKPAGGGDMTTRVLKDLGSKQKSVLMHPC